MVGMEWDDIGLDGKNETSRDTTMHIDGVEWDKKIQDDSIYYPRSFKMIFSAIIYEFYFKQRFLLVDFNLRPKKLK